MQYLKLIQALLSIYKQKIEHLDSRNQVEVKFLWQISYPPANGASQGKRVPPADLKLTPNQQGVPQKEEEKNGEKIWGMALKNR